MLVVISELASGLPLAPSAVISSLLGFSEIFASLLRSAADCGTARSELIQGSNYCRTSSDLFNGNLPSFNHSALILLQVIKLLLFELL